MSVFTWSLVDRAVKCVYIVVIGACAKIVLSAHATASHPVRLSPLLLHDTSTHFGNAGAAFRVGDLRPSRSPFVETQARTRPRPAAARAPQPRRAPAARGHRASWRCPRHPPKHAPAMHCSASSSAGSPASASRPAALPAASALSQPAPRATLAPDLSATAHAAILSRRSRHGPPPRDAPA